MTAEHEPPAAHGHEPMLPEGPVEFVCRMLCRIALIAMIVIIDVEIFTRNVFDFSFYMSDEYGGYLLVALTFLSLPLCISHGSFHRVTVVLNRLPRWGAEWMLIGFNLLAVVFGVLVLWQVVMLTANSWSLHVTAPTLLMTPLWMPQLLMPIGMAATLVTLVRLLFRRLACLQMRG